MPNLPFRPAFSRKVTSIWRWNLQLDFCVFNYVNHARNQSKLQFLHNPKKPDQNSIFLPHFLSQENP